MNLFNKEYVMEKKITMHKNSVKINKSGDYIDINFENLTELDVLEINELLARAKEKYYPDQVYTNDDQLEFDFENNNKEK
jgi:hypothetical protein